MIFLNGIHAQEKAGSKKPTIPAYQALGGKLFVYEPVSDPTVNARIDLSDLSYAYTYNMYFIEKDTLWKQQMASYHARNAEQIVKEVFESVVILSGEKLQSKHYTEVLYANLGKYNPYRILPNDVKKDIREFLVPSSNVFQLFIETRTYQKRSGELYTRFIIRVFDSREVKVVYSDNLAFRFDVRDNQTFRTALKFMLERLKENSVPPAGTRAGQNRR